MPHRHLIGIESPPERFVPDDMTQGPNLPPGWDGDAWMAPEGEGYFLRAWNKEAGKCSFVLGDRYEDTRRKLIDDVDAGGSFEVKIVIERIRS